MMLNIPAWSLGRGVWEKIYRLKSSAHSLKTHFGGYDGR
jgi:hypothetical protein